MGPRALTEQEVVDKLYSLAIPNGKCLECHLACSSDRPNRERPFVSVGGRNGKKWRASRLVWHVEKGPIPEDIWVLHECDNYKCINLDHLFLGTAQDNINDMIAKGRKVDDLELGERRKVSTGKLLGTLHAKGMSKRDITNHLRISYTTVWSYFDGPNRGYLTVPSRD